MSLHIELKTLAQFVEYMGEDRNVSVSREISKNLKKQLGEVLQKY